MKTFLFAAALALGAAGFGLSAQAAPVASGIATHQSLPGAGHGNILQVQFHRDRRRFGRWGGKCVAVATTINGRRIPGTRGVGRGFPRVACRRAISQCRRALNRRQLVGRNPFGQCQIVRRGF